MGFKDKIRKKLRETLTPQPRRERPNSLPPQKKQSIDDASSSNFASSQDGSLHRTGRRMSAGNAEIGEAPLPVSEPNSTAPTLVPPKGSGQLDLGAVAPSPATAASVPHVVISVAGDDPSLSPTGEVSCLCSDR